MQKTLIGLVALGAFVFTTQSVVRGVYERAINPTVQALHGARLVGSNCQGVSGKFYGVEESDFPQCEKIELINKESE